MENDPYTPQSTNAAEHIRRSVVVCGHVGPARSDIGLSLARRLHRPCLDFANAGIGSGSRPPLDDDDDRMRAERSWAETLIRSAFGHVIVAPCTALDVINDRATKTQTWTVWLDRDIDVLVQEATTAAPDLDVEAFRRHIDETRPLLADFDEVIDTSGLPADAVAEQLTERWRATMRQSSRTSEPRPHTHGTGTNRHADHPSGRAEVSSSAASNRQSSGGTRSE